MQRPTVTAHIAVVIAALYHILAPMQIMLAGDVLPEELLFFSNIDKPT